VSAEPASRAYEVDSPAFRAINDAVLAVAGELDVDTILERLADSARALTGCRYAAIGVPDGEGGFAKFVASGMTDKQWDALGELPRTHGVLGAMLETVEPYRTLDIQADPRFQGWPAAHPNMTTFLGVPIVAKGRVLGAFYLTNVGPRGAPFTDAGQRLIETLAAHAALALEHAELYERSRELSVVEERNRLARDLHDSVTQTLFSLSLTAESAATLADSNPAAAREQIHAVQQLAASAMQEMRSLIFELRPAEVETEGLVPTLRKHVDVLRKVYEPTIELVVKRERRLPPALERELFRVAQEALNNALKHARAEEISVEVDVSDRCARLAVRDRGVGFEPADAQRRSRRLGLVSMHERARELGAELEIHSRPGKGTVVTLDLPLDGARLRRRSPR
jgi:signal transduction histidine kinase